MARLTRHTGTGTRAANADGRAVSRTIPSIGTVLLALFLATSLYHFKSRWLAPSGEADVTASSGIGQAGQRPTVADKDLPIPLPERGEHEAAKTNALEAGEPPVTAVAAPRRADVTPPRASPSALPVSPAALSGLIDQIPCSALVASANDGVVKLQGFLSNPLDRERLEERILSVPGVRELSGDVHTLGVDKPDADECDVLGLYGSYWVRNKRLNLGASVNPVQPGNTFTEGENLVFDITTPAYPSYVNIDYFTRDGAVIHLVPSPEISDNQAPANYRATLGDLGEWRIGPPFGNDLVAFLLTPEPLFRLPRPPDETGPDYLRALTKRLKEMEVKHDAARFAADLLLITTQSRSKARTSKSAR